MKKNNYKLTGILKFLFDSEGQKYYCLSQDIDADNKKYLVQHKGGRYEIISASGKAKIEE